MNYRFFFSFALPLLLTFEWSAVNSQTLTSYPGSHGNASIVVSPVGIQNFSEGPWLNSIRPGKTRRTIGIVMVLLGASVQAAGVVKFKEGVDLENQGTGSKSDPSGIPRMLGGVGIAIIGTGIAVSGTVLWIKGAKKFGDYKKAQQQSLRLKVNSGISLSYQF